MKWVGMALLWALSAVAAETPESNVCEYKYSQQVTVHNGNKVEYACYPVLERSTCGEGYHCGKGPMMVPTQCSFPPEVRKRRCVRKSGG